MHLLDGHARSLRCHLQALSSRANQVYARRLFCLSGSAPRHDVHRRLCGLIQQNETGPVVAASQLDADVSGRITDPEHRLTVRLDSELRTYSPGSVGQLQAAPAKDRRLTLGKYRSKMTE